MKPASSAAPMAASSRRIASVVVGPDRDDDARVAPIAQAAIATPSMTAYGSRSMSVRSVRAAGSAP